MMTRKFAKPETIKEFARDNERLSALCRDLGRLYNMQGAAIEVGLFEDKDAHNGLLIRLVATAPQAVSETAFAEHIAKVLSSTWDLLQTAAPRSEPDSGKAEGE